MAMCPDYRWRSPHPDSNPNPVAFESQELFKDTIAWLEEQLKKKNDMLELNDILDQASTDSPTLTLTYP